jgi:hypothetical protein
MKRPPFVQTFWGIVAASVVAALIAWPFASVKFTDLFQSDEQKNSRWRTLLEQAKRDGRLLRISSPLARTQMYLDPRNNVTHHAYQFSLLDVPVDRTASVHLERNNAPCYILIPDASVSWCAGHAMATDGPLEVTFWVTQRDHERHIVSLENWNWSVIDTKGRRATGTPGTTRLDVFRDEFQPVVLRFPGFYNLREWDWNRDFTLVVAHRDVASAVRRVRMTVDVNK